MTLVKQFGALLRMNLASIPSRLGLVFTIVIGVTCAVGVLVSMLAMGTGAREEAMGNVRPDRVVLTTTDSQSAIQSSIPRETMASIRELPGIRKNAAGDPIVVGQVLVFVQARGKADEGLIRFPIAGMSPGMLDYLPDLRMTAGRMFQPGLREMIASNKCAQQFKDFTAGDKRTLRGGEWSVVGNFSVGRSAGNCVVFADADTILSAFGRNTFNMVNVMLQSEATLPELERALEADPTLRVALKPEAQVREEQTRQVNGILNFVSYFVGSIMALAATIGAANSMYAIVDGRRRELATLRALGFDSVAIVASMLLESIVLALPGAVIGALLAWAFFNGLLASPFGTSFRLAVTPSLALLGLGWALGMGLLSGLLPAVRASRVSVTSGLRAV